MDNFLESFLYTGYILLAVVVLIKALHEPIIGILVVILVSSNLDNCKQFRSEISSAIRNYFRRLFQKLCKLLFLMGDDSLGDGGCCGCDLVKEGLDSYAWFGNCEFLDASPIEQLRVPVCVGNRRRRYVLPARENVGNFVAQLNPGNRNY